MKVETLESKVQKVPVRRLRVADRCDACGARAYVRVAVKGLPLDFCAHHFRRHAEALESSGATVVFDERFALEEEVRNRK